MSFSTATKEPGSPIGRSAVIRVGSHQYVGTIIDAAGRKAKRVRIQSQGQRQGDVLMPGEYVLMEFV